MRLNLQKLSGVLDKTTRETCEHTAPVCGVEWLNADELITAGDDHQVLLWNVVGRNAKRIQLISSSSSATVKTNIYPTCIQISPKADGIAMRGAAGSSTSRTLAMATTEGKLYLLNTSGRVDKVVDAHKGAVLACRWSQDGLSFVTAGEDGAVKIWSKNGMLRSIVAQNSRPVYALDWNPAATKVAFCSGDECFIKPLKAQSGAQKWRAHAGVILCLTWTNVDGSLLVTGGEDYRYRIWDEMGRPIFASSAFSFPITALRWSPVGDLLAVGTYNSLSLCDRAGWFHCVERPSCGSVYTIAWSADGAQLAAGCADGSLYHAHVVRRREVWENLEAIQTEPKIVEVQDLTAELSMERLETRDRISRFRLAYGYLIVTTSKICYIYSSKTWNTPVSFDLKEGTTVTLILMCERYFLLVDTGRIVAQVFNYEGRLQSQLRWPGAAEGGGLGVGDALVALANDALVVRDSTLHNVLHFFDTVTGNPVGDQRLAHTCEICELALNQCDAFAERRVAFVDANGDAFLAAVNSYSTLRRVEKIGSQVTDLTFNNATNQLAGFQSGQLVVWILPTVVFIDSKLLPKTIVNCAGAENLGKSAAILSFIGNTLMVRCSDGSVLAFYVTPYAAGILRYARAANWSRAVRICRTVKEDFLWATLAGLAAAARNFEVAEICYSNLSETEKVLYLSALCGESDAQLRAARVALFTGRVGEAHAALADSAHQFHAIILRLSLFDFDGALELALKYNMHLDTVLGYRLRYLEQTGRRENDSKFLRHLSQVEIDWPHICEKIRNDRIRYGGTFI